MAAGQRYKRQPSGCRPSPDAQDQGQDPSASSGSTGESPLSHLTGWIRGRIRAAGERLYEEPDRRARGYGWQVTVRHGGLARRYRDPRFDMLAGCGKCGGTGAGAADRPCPRCSGTGRLVLGQEPGSGMRSQP